MILLQLLLSLNQVDHFEGLANGMTVPLGTLCLGQAQDLLQTLALECEEVLQCLVVSHFFSAPLGAIVHMPCWRCFWGSEAAQPFDWFLLLLLLQPCWVGGWVGSNGKWEKVSGPSKASPGMPRHPPHPSHPTPPHPHPHTRIANAATLAGELASRSSIVSSLTRTNFWMGSWWLLQCFRLMNRIPTMLMIKGRAFTWWGVGYGVGQQAWKAAINQQGLLAMLTGHPAPEGPQGICVLGQRRWRCSTIRVLVAHSERSESGLCKCKISDAWPPWAAPWPRCIWGACSCKGCKGSCCMDRPSVTSWCRQSWYCNAAWLHAAAVSGCSGEASCQCPFHQHVGCCGDSGRPLLPW